MARFDAGEHYVGRTADRYDDERRSEAKWRREDEIVERFLEVASPASVVDVPVGTGRFFGLYGGIDRVIGIDISPDMLARAAGSAAAKVELRTGDITALDLGDRTVEAAVCIRFLNLVPAGVVGAALRELARVSSAHVIFGVRTTHRGGLRGLRWRVRARLGRGKVTVHREEVVGAAMAAAGLTVLDSAVVDTWPGRATYRIVLASVG